LRAWCALAGLLLGVSWSTAQPSSNPEDRDPVFQPYVVQPAQFATLTIGGGANPSVGGFQCVDMVLAGEHPWIAAWSLDEPLLSPREQTSVAAAALAALGTGGETAPLMEIALLLGGDKGRCWRLYNPEQVRPIPPDLLKAVRDVRAISGRPGNGLELEAFLQTVIQAHETSAAAFQRAARRDLAFADLFRDPAAYRGEVVHVEGRLRLLQKSEAPAMLKLVDVHNLYYGWVFDDLSGGNPYCVIVTEPPADITLNQRINQPVTFDGYFYMKRRYKAEDSKKPNEYREAPLLIGHSLIVSPVESAAADTSTAWPKGMLWSFLGLAAGVMLFVVGLGYWFRWNDARVRRRVTATKQFVDPGTSSDGAAWSLTDGPAFSEGSMESPPVAEWGDGVQ
jgi:hypothetical protein